MKYKIGSFLDTEMQFLADAIRTDTDDTIVLMINSEGGYVMEFTYFASAIYEAKARGKRIITYTPASCMSAGFALLLMGDDIYCSPFSMMLHHNSQFVNLKDKVISWFTGDTVGRKLDVIVEQVYPPTIIDKIKNYIKLEGLWKKADYYMTAQEFKAVMPTITIGFPPELYDDLIPWFVPEPETLDLVDFIDGEEAV